MSPRPTTAALGRLQGPNPRSPLGYLRDGAQFKNKCVFRSHFGSRPIHFSELVSGLLLCGLWPHIRNPSGSKRPTGLFVLVFTFAIVCFSIRNERMQSDGTPSDEKCVCHGACGTPGRTSSTWRTQKAVGQQQHLRPEHPNQERLEHGCSRRPLQVLRWARSLKGRVHQKWRKPVTCAARRATSPRCAGATENRLRSKPQQGRKEEER